MVVLLDQKSFEPTLPDRSTAASDSPVEVSDHVWTIYAEDRS